MPGYNLQGPRSTYLKSWRSSAIINYPTPPTSKSQRPSTKATPSLLVPTNRHSSKEGWSILLLNLPCFLPFSCFP
jgi:hypothetical protein